MHTVDLFLGCERQLLWNLGEQMEPVDFKYTVKWKDCGTGTAAEFEVVYTKHGVRLVYVRARPHTNHTKRRYVGHLTSYQIPGS